MQGSERFEKKRSKKSIIIGTRYCQKKMQRMVLTSLILFVRTHHAKKKSMNKNCSKNTLQRQDRTLKHEEDFAVHKFKKTHNLLSQF
jgi:hypothetical protein